MRPDDCDFFEHLDQGAVITLEPSDYDGVPDKTVFLLASLDEFLPIFRPLTAELHMFCFHPEWHFPEDKMQVEHPTWFMHTSWLPKNLLKSLHVNPINEEIDEITIDALSEWMLRACNQKCKDCQDYLVNWDALIIGATCAQVFDVDRFADRRSLRMQCAERPRNIIDVPVIQDGDKLWIWGPNQAMQKNIASAPFRVLLYRWLVTFHLEIHWSLWTEPTAPGFQMIGEIVQQLIGKGWKVSFASEPFSKTLKV